MKSVNYVITVDVRGMSIEDKKKAQDAFFKLGIGWQYGGKSYWSLREKDHTLYTNKDRMGVSGHLLACYEVRVMPDDGAYRPTHTLQQLRELAGMDSLQDLSSDELRGKLDDNTSKSEKLLLQNEEITELLRSRGFVPVEIGQNVPLDDDPKPLTLQDLKEGGWWMASATEEDRISFRKLGLGTLTSFYDYNSCSLIHGDVVGWYELNYRLELNEIHRIGEDFFWGAPPLWL